MYQEMKKLSNGIEIPVLALGTWFIDDDKVAEVLPIWDLIILT